MEVKDVRISLINIGDRHRKEIGDIEPLAQSIDKLGLMQPIGVTERNQLVWGLRRLTAARDILKWKTIPAQVVNMQEIILGEHDENVLRKDFTVEERVEIGKKVEKLLGIKPVGRPAKEKFGQMTEFDTEESIIPNMKEEPRETAARAAAMSEPTYRRAKEVMANGTPELKEAVNKGDVSIADAALVAKSPKATQKKAVEQVQSGKAKTLKQAVNGKPVANFDKAVSDAFGKLIQAVDNHARYFGCVTKHGKIEETTVHVACRSAFKAWKEWTSECESNKG